MTNRKRPAAARERAARPPTLALIVAAVVALAAAGGWVWMMWRGSAAPLVRTRDQNVLLITIDTLRADALGSYGGQANTPNLDRLASEGTRFDFAHAQAVVTLPSHASILTGLYPFQHGVRDNAGFRLTPDKTTIAARLKQIGFATGAFVGAFPVDHRFGLNAGFDVYDDHYAGTAAPVDFVMPERRADEVVAPARAWIRSQHGPWFAWVHVFDPHAPYQPPPPYDREYAGREYYGEVAFTDAALGPLIDDARASARPTLVVVTGDHGEGLGDHGELTHGVFAYEATLRVPLIVAELGGPSRTRVSSVVPDPARHVDIVPTILDAVGEQVPQGLPGRSLFARGGDDRARDGYFEAMMPALTRGWAPLTGVLVGREKLIELPIPELYDLSADTAEKNNLYDRAPDRARMLSARLASFGPIAPGTAQAEDPDVAARLRSLGYTASTATQKPRYTEADDPKRLIQIDELMHRASNAFVAGNADQAIATYREVLGRRPDSESAWRYLALVEWQVGRRRDATATLEDALRNGVHTESLRTQLAIYLAETGDPDRALSIVGDRDTTDPDVTNAIGIALARAGKPAQAAGVFERFLARDPTSAIAWQNLGTIRLDRGDLAGAREALQKAVALDPKLSGAWTGLGVAEMKAGRRDAAFDAWRRAVQLDGREYDALYDLATELVSAGRTDEAVPYLERFAATAPPDAYARELARVRQFLARRPR